MPLKVRCSNILRYDASAGKYVHCEHEFVADQQHAGSTVECPQCGGAVELPKLDLEDPQAGFLLADGGVVPVQSLAQSPTPSVTAAAHDNPAVDDVFADAPLHSSPPASAEDIEFDEPPATFRDEDFADVAAPPSESEPAPLDDPLSQDLFADAAAGELTGLESAASSRMTLQVSSYCPNCGGQILDEAQMCSQCGFHKTLNRQLDNRQLPPQPASVTGFHLWLHKALADYESVEGVLTLLKILGALFVLTIFVTLYVVLGLVALAVILPALALILVWIVGKSRRRRSGAAASPRQSAWWAAILVLGRMFQWREVGWPFRKRVVLNLRGQDIDDEAVLRLEGLDRCIVLDLQGTQVTDVALTYLTGFRQLRFIVLRKTNVTHQGVERLQQSLPAAWIWH